MDDRHTDEVHDEEKAVHDTEEIECHAIKIDQQDRQAERKEKTGHQRDQRQPAAELVRWFPADQFQRFGITSRSMPARGMKIIRLHPPAMQRDISRRDHQPGRSPERPIGRTGVGFGQNEGAERRRIEQP